MATIEKPQVFEAPGREGSLVEVAERYDNFIGGGWVAPAKGWVPGEPQPGYR
jgi:aldehyde dehydrogenase